MSFYLTGLIAFFFSVSSFAQATQRPEEIATLMDLCSQTPLNEKQKSRALSEFRNLLKKLNENPRNLKYLTKDEREKIFSKYIANPRTEAPPDIEHETRSGRFYANYLLTPSMASRHSCGQSDLYRFNEKNHIFMGSSHIASLDMSDVEKQTIYERVHSQSLLADTIIIEGVSTDAGYNSCNQVVLMLSKPLDFFSEGEFAILAALRKNKRFIGGMVPESKRMAFIESSPNMQKLLSSKERKERPLSEHIALAQALQYFNHGIHREYFSPPGRPKKASPPPSFKEIFRQYGIQDLENLEGSFNEKWKTFTSWYAKHTITKLPENILPKKDLTGSDESKAVNAFTYFSKNLDLLNLTSAPLLLNRGSPQQNPLSNRLIILDTEARNRHLASLFETLAEKQTVMSVYGDSHRLQLQPVLESKLSKTQTFGEELPSCLRASEKPKAQGGPSHK